LAAGEEGVGQPEPESGAASNGTQLIRVSDGVTVRTYPLTVWGIDIAPDGKRISFIEAGTRYQELRTATMDLKGRTTIASTYGVWRYEFLYSLYPAYLPRPATTKWSLDGSHVGLNVYADTGDLATFRGPFLGVYTARGRGFTVPPVLARKFDW
jgi:hypothetical protein